MGKELTLGLGVVVTCISSSKIGTKSGLIRLECLLVSGNDLTTISLVEDDDGSSNVAFFFLMISLRSSSPPPLPFRDSWSECELIRLSISARRVVAHIDYLIATYFFDPL